MNELLNKVLKDPEYHVSSDSLIVISGDSLHGIYDITNNKFLVRSRQPVFVASTRIKLVNYVIGTEVMGFIDLQRREAYYVHISQTDTTFFGAKSNTSGWDSPLGETYCLYANGLFEYNVEEIPSQEQNTEEDDPFSIDFGDSNLGEMTYISLSRNHNYVVGGDQYFEASSGDLVRKFDGEVKKYMDYYVESKFHYTSYFDSLLNPIFTDIERESFEARHFEFFTGRKIQKVEHLRDDVYLCTIEGSPAIFRYATNESH